MCLMAIPSREVTQTLASTTSEWGLDSEVWAALPALRVRMNALRTIKGN